MASDRIDQATPALLGRFRQGDRGAYDELFTRYKRRLIAFIRRNSSPWLERHVSADDILQETHLEAIRCLPSFEYRRELAFYMWLCGIAHNRIRNHCRRLSRRPPPLSLSIRTAGAATSSQDLLQLLRAGDPDPAHRTLMREQVDLLAAAIASLPDIYREAIVLRFLEGHANREAARRAGVGHEAFRPRVRRGLEKLQRLLDEALSGGGAPRLP